MVSTDRIEQAENNTGTGLVPLTPTLEWVHKMPLPLPDPTFVTQLIANAEHVSPMSRPRRASRENAKLAYRSTRLLPGAGARTMQLA